ncbi:MAG: glucose-6-phosphate dehydrogenase assembly protein OpcA [Chloroflexota bacterium]|nr:glucose-6-phosphate dehydrogenase assembly protein OpcA [Chloroflexota bacterium]
MVSTVHAERHPLTDAQEIERELVDLWRELGNIDRPVIRARVLTLLVAAPEEREDEIVDCLQRLTERHPARNILLLIGDKEAEPQLDAAATLICVGREEALCAEQIRIHAAGASRERVSSAVRMLLTADLPVVLWWALPPYFGDPLLDELAHLADRIFVDTDTLCEPEALHRALLTWHDGRISDLNWSRINAWRELVAGFFDPSNYRVYLDQIEQVTVESGSCQVDAWLFAGWLASRLDWELQSAAAGRWRFARPDGEAAEVRFSRSEQEQTLRSITLQAGDAIFRIERVGRSSAQCQVEIAGEQALQQVTHLSDVSIPTLVSCELDMMSQDFVYHEALAVLRKALGKLDNV